MQLSDLFDLCMVQWLGGAASSIPRKRVRAPGRGAEAAGASSEPCQSQLPPMVSFGSVSVGPPPHSHVSLVALNAYQRPPAGDRSSLCMWTMVFASSPHNRCNISNDNGLSAEQSANKN